MNRDRSGRRAGRVCALALSVSVLTTPLSPVRAVSDAHCADAVMSESELLAAIAAFVDSDATCDVISIAASFDVDGPLIVNGAGGLDFPDPTDRSLTILGNGHVLTGNEIDGGFLVYLGGGETARTLTIDNLGMTGFSGWGAVTVGANAIDEFPTDLVISRSRFSSNIHSGSPTSGVSDELTAGAINTHGRLQIDDSEFASNTGYSGGAVSVTNDSSTVISRTTFSNNTARTYGGAIRTNGELSIDTSTLTGNEANQSAAISADKNVTILFSTIVDNTSTVGAAITLATGSELRVAYSIVAGNSQPDISASGVPDIEFSFLTSPSSVTVDFAPFALDPLDTNLYGADPVLDQLGDYGGFTLPGDRTIRTRPPTAGSPVIDTIELVAAGAIDPQTDQRGSGFERLVNGIADMGAVEYRPTEPDRIRMPVWVLDPPSSLPDTA